jgi:hypothetical protein
MKMSFQKSSFNSVVLTKGFLKAEFDCESFNFQISNDFKTIQKRKCFVLENKDFQKIWFSKLALISTLLKNLIYLGFKSFANHSIITQARFEN